MRIRSIVAAVAAFAAAAALIAQTPADKADPKPSPKFSSPIAEAYAKYLQTNPRPKLDPFKLTPGQMGVLDTGGIDTSKYDGRGNTKLTLSAGAAGNIMISTSAFLPNHLIVNPFQYRIPASGKFEIGPDGRLKANKIGDAVVVRGFPTEGVELDGPIHIPQVLFVTKELVPHKAKGNLMLLAAVPDDVAKEVQSALGIAPEKADPKTADPAKPLTGVAKLVADLKHANVETRRKACMELGKMGPKAAEAAAALKEVAEKDGNDFVKKAAAAALMKVEKK